MTSEATEFSVVDVPERRRFELREGDRVAAFAQYSRSAGEIALVHTETAPEYEGKGVGSRLVAGALDAARSEGLAVLPFCPFVRRYIAEHADIYLDLVPAARRDEFGLPVT